MRSDPSLCPSLKWVGANEMKLTLRHPVRAKPRRLGNAGDERPTKGASSMLTDLCRLKALGKDVKVFPLAKIVNPEVVEIGDGTQIDDFIFIYGGQGVKIGRLNHFASFTSVIGGGELVTEDYVGIATGCRLIPGTPPLGRGHGLDLYTPRSDT